MDLLAAIRFPILERIPLFGDAAVSPHGLGIAIGFALGAVLMIRRAEKRGLGRLYVPNVSEAVQELLTRAAVGAILGARGFYVLTHLSDFEGRWHEVLYVWQGGLTFLGGVTGAILLAIPFARRRGYGMTMLLDSAAPGIALGLLVGRVGDLMIGDHIGAPTDFPLAWECTGNWWVRATNSIGYVDPLAYPSAGPNPTAGCFDVAVHHTALYDFGATLVVLGVLLLMERRRWFDGAFIAAWVYVYGALRFASDFARQDKTWFGLTGSQWALVGAAALVTAWLLRTAPWKRRRWAWDLEFAHPWKQEGYEPSEDEAAPTPGEPSTDDGEALDTAGPAGREREDRAEVAALAAPVHPGEGPTMRGGGEMFRDPPSVPDDEGADDDEPPASPLGWPGDAVTDAAGTDSAGTESAGTESGVAASGDEEPARDTPPGAAPTSRRPDGAPAIIEGVSQETLGRVTRSTDDGPRMARRRTHTDTEGT